MGTAKTKNMKTIEFTNENLLKENFEICIVSGEETYVSGTDFKEFYEFDVCFDVGKKDKHGMSDLLIIKMTREQWNQIQNKFEYEFFQLPKGTKEEDFIETLKSGVNIINDKITELFEKYELQGFDS